MHMHSYSINSRKRESVVHAIAIISFVYGLVISILDIRHAFESSFGIQQNNFIWIILLQMFATLSPVTIYGIFITIYKKWLWKLPIFQNYHGIPDFNGIWEGELSSFLKGEKRKITILIKQDWDKIKIQTYTNKGAKAESTLASINVDNTGAVFLSYAFDNIREKSTYIGFNCLRYYEDELMGEYFTNKQLTNGGVGSKGTLRVKRKR